MLCVLRGGSWQGPQDLGAGRDPLVALSDGAGFVAWTDPNVGALVAARYASGQLQSPVTAVAAPVSDGDLAVMSNGDAAVVAPFNAELRSYHYDALSAAWNATARTLAVSSNAVGGSPRIGASADGFTAAYEETDLATSQVSIRAARYTPATGWTATQEFANVAAGESGEINPVALDTAPPGHALAVLDFKQHKSLSASAHDASGSGWTPTVLHADTEPQPPLYASGGVDSLGRAWVVWGVHPPFADFELRGRRYSGGWGTTELVYKTYFVSSAAVNVADSGRALLLWIEAGPPDMVLQGAVAEPGGSFAVGSKLLEHFLAVDGSLRVATGPNGHTVAAWVEMPFGMTAGVIDW